MTKKTETTHQELQKSSIEILLKSISEDLLLQAYQKEAALEPEKYTTKVKKSTSFYVTIYYKGKIVRSRSISTLMDENNKANHDTEEIHFSKCQNFIENGSKYSTFEESKKTIPIFGIKLGQTVIVVSNSNFASTQLFAFILASAFVLNKAILLIKEAGSWNDLLEFVKNDKAPHAKNYLVRLQKVAFGELGGY